MTTRLDREAVENMFLRERIWIQERLHNLEEVLMNELDRRFSRFHKEWSKDKKRRTKSEQRSKETQTEKVIIGDDSWETERASVINKVDSKHSMRKESLEERQRETEAERRKVDFEQSMREDGLMERVRDNVKIECPKEYDSQKQDIKVKQVDENVLMQDLEHLDNNMDGGMKPESVGETKGKDRQTDVMKELPEVNHSTTLDPTSNEADLKVLPQDLEHPKNDMDGGKDLSIQVVPLLRNGNVRIINRKGHFKKEDKPKNTIDQRQKEQNAKVYVNNTSTLLKEKTDMDLSTLPLPVLRCSDVGIMNWRSDVKTKHKSKTTWQYLKETKAYDKLKKKVDTQEKYKTDHPDNKDGKEEMQRTNVALLGDISEDFINSGFLSKPETEHQPDRQCKSETVLDKLRNTINQHKSRRKQKRIENHLKLLNAPMEKQQEIDAFTTLKIFQDPKLKVTKPAKCKDFSIFLAESTAL
ncbi:uncharacterized protein LOC109616184 isoform X2 [Esox lucius]|nr:uncharacterized protein LOC109616184 isoform X2 [Esox lucius]